MIELKLEGGTWAEIRCVNSMSTCFLFFSRLFYLLMEIKQKFSGVIFKNGNVEFQGWENITVYRAFPGFKKTIEARITIAPQYWAMLGHLFAGGRLARRRINANADDAHVIDQWFIMVGKDLNRTVHLYPPVCEQPLTQRKVPLENFEPLIIFLSQCYHICHSVPFLQTMWPHWRLGLATGLSTGLAIPPIFTPSGERKFKT